nr:YlxR family protein [Oryzihumus leptocrescens]
MGCRSRDDRSSLLRVVAVWNEQEHQLVAHPDPRRRLPGRGAWLHPTPECLELAVRRRAFARALRVKAPLDTSRVRAHVLEEQQAVVGGSQEPSEHATESG